MARKKATDNIITLKPKAEPLYFGHENAYISNFHEVFGIYGLERQKQIIEYLAKELGGIYSILLLPNKLMMEIIGATATLMSPDHKNWWKQKYYEKLAEVYCYLSGIDEEDNKIVDLTKHGDTNV